AAAVKSTALVPIRPSAGPTETVPACAAAGAARLASTARTKAARARTAASMAAVLDGIHCLPIPTPFAVGRVNTYLIEDDPLTLVDTGPNSGKALDELETALRAHGRRGEDLELIVISHQHMDHPGLVDILARRSAPARAALA